MSKQTLFDKVWDSHVVRKINSIVLSLLLLSSTSSVFSQKADIDRLRFKYSHISLPKKPIENALTYSSEIGFQNDKIKLKSKPELTLDGFARVNDAADIRIFLKIKDIISKTEFMQNDQKIKDKEGKESILSTYNILVSNRVYYDLLILDSKGTKLVEELEKDIIDRSKAAKEDFKTVEQRNNWMTDYRVKNSDAFVEEAIQKVIFQKQQELSDNYGYPEKDDFYVLLYLNPKKHSEGKEYQSRIQHIAKYIGDLTANKELNPDSLKSDLEYITSLIEKYPTDDKNDKKIRASVFYNIGLVNLCLNKFDIALENFRLSEEIDKNNFIPDLQNQIHLIEDQFKINNVFSRKINRKELLDEALEQNATKAAANLKTKLASYAGEIKEYEREKELVKERRGYCYSTETKAYEIIQAYFNAIGGIDLINSVRSLKIETASKMNVLPIPMKQTEIVVDTNFYYIKNGKSFIFNKEVYDRYTEEKYSTNDTDKSEEWVEEKMQKKAKNMSEKVGKMSVWSYLIPFDISIRYKYYGDTVLNNKTYHILVNELIDSENPMDYFSLRSTEYGVLLDKYLFEKESKLYYGSISKYEVTGEPYSATTFSDYDYISKSENILIPMKNETEYILGPNKLGLKKLAMIQKIKKIELNIEINKEEIYKELRKTEWTEKIPNSEKNDF